MPHTRIWNPSPTEPNLTLEQQCGQLLVVGFDGTEVPDELAESIHQGKRGGVILFRRNLPDLESAWRLCSSIHRAFPAQLTPFIGIDEEGGRVTRLPPPFKPLPPMRKFGEQASTTDLFQLGCWLGARLAALGITCNFAPVLDVDSNPLNPIIGDRSFSSEPQQVFRCALALIDGMQSQGVAACGKHFPGHGDTTADSHVSLPTVNKSVQELMATELVPFRACARSSLASMMVAHVAFPALDDSGVPATFSSRILDKLLRDELGFAGVLFSDDLEMGAIASRWSPDFAVSQAVRAGCDALLICRDTKRADQALVTLVQMAQRDELLHRKIQRACSRFLRMRRRFLPRPVLDVDCLARVFSNDARASQFGVFNQ